jgi:four helix bundle protein
MGREKINKVEDLIIWQKAMDLYDDFMRDDSEVLGKDYRGREIVRQLIRSIGSISANIEEGYGRATGREFKRYLIISRASARESKGWYLRSKTLINSYTIDSRIKGIDEILAMINSMINKVG